MLNSHLIEKFQEVLKTEIDHVKKDLYSKGAVTLEINGGYLIGEEGDGFLYRFFVKYLERDIVSGIQGSYLDNQAWIKAIIENSNPGNDSIDIVLEKNVGNVIDGGIVNFDVTFLLQKLHDLLEEMKENPFVGNIKMIDAVFSKTSSYTEEKLIDDYNLNDDQKNSIRKALGSQVCYIWGPPGTGKTTTIGALVNECVLRGKRVLVVSHTNIAVDTALKSVMKVKNGTENSYLVVRYGYISPDRKKDLLDVYDAVDIYIKERGKYEEIEAFLKYEGCRLNKMSLSSNLMHVYKTNKKLEIPVEYVQMVDDLKKKVLLECDVLGTTISKVTIDDFFSERSCFDVVIIDEVSMVAPPQIFFIAGKAKDKVVFSGDFNQLPPVVQSKDVHVQNVLGENVFGLMEYDDPDEEFERRPILTIQYRMHPDICTIINQLYYGGRLRTDKILVENAFPSKSSACCGPLLLLDSSEMGVEAKTTANNSRENSGHVEIIFSLMEYVFDRNDESTIGIISPYRAQVRLVKKRLFEQYPDSIKSGKISVNTIHSFQGQEKDLIIIDLVDTPPVPPVFLNEMRNRHLKKLLNVAASRTKKRLLVIAHRQHFEKMTPTGDVTKFLESIDRWGTAIDARFFDEFLDESFLEGYPSTKRKMSMPQIRQEVQSTRWIQWSGRKVPILEFFEDEVLINIEKFSSNFQKLIPYYEVEAFRNSSGQWVSTLTGEMCDDTN